MTTHNQGRSRLRISDQDALLKWCRSNGFSLKQRTSDSPLVFDIRQRAKPESSSEGADFVLTSEDHAFSVRDRSGQSVAQGAELREILKQLSNHLANAHSEAS